MKCSRTGTVGVLCPLDREGSTPLPQLPFSLALEGSYIGKNLAVEEDIRPELPAFALSPTLHVWNTVRIFENPFLSKAMFFENLLE